MEKSKHIYHGEIEYSELNNFIEPIKMTISIPSKMFGNLFKNSQIVTKYIKSIYNESLKYLHISYNDRSILLNSIVSLTYTPHITGYDFRINPIEFVNNILNSYRIDFQIPYINLDSDQGINYFKDLVRCNIIDYINKKGQLNVNSMNMLSELINNIDLISSIYKVDISKVVSKYCIPKDMLLYLSYESLLKYIETKDLIYAIMPFEYYNYVSHMKNSYYPHKLLYQDKKIWFTDFRYLYEQSIGSNSKISINAHQLLGKDIFLAWQLIKPGMVDSIYKDKYIEIMSSINNKQKKDIQKYIELFKIKWDYFMNSPYIYHLKGLYGLSGYSGFSYKNEYLVFDKFYNMPTTNSIKTSILTNSEAIYALPSDKFSLVKTDKQKIISESKLDKRIRRINHTSNNSFINRLDSVIKGPNVSSDTLENVLSKEKEKVLIIK